MLSPVPYSFTFHHVSIKTLTHLKKRKAVIYSHSTMYLLKLTRLIIFDLWLFDSHSTMYLLKPSNTGTDTTTKSYTFTFHHVSIKTRNKGMFRNMSFHSHSTMYLLKRLTHLKKRKAVIYSHSTMYLLKRKCGCAMRYESDIHIPPCIY